MKFYYPHLFAQLVNQLFLDILHQPFDNDRNVVVTHVCLCLVLQDTAKGREVLRVSAHDPDLGHQGLVTYTEVSTD